MDAIERQLQRLDPQYPREERRRACTTCCCRSAISTDDEICCARDRSPEVAASVDALVAARRVLTRPDRRRAALHRGRRCGALSRRARRAAAAGHSRIAARSRSRDPLGDLALRYARTHAPFTAADFAARYGLTPAAAEALLVRLTGEGRLLEGEFRPGGTRREWTDPGVLRMLRRRSLAKLRHEVEPVDQAVLGRFATTWQGIVKRRRGADALLDAIEQLQGAPLPASILETEILPARLDAYDPADLDAVMAAGEVVWVGVEPLGERDGRIALYLADHLARPAAAGRRSG